MKQRSPLLILLGSLLLLLSLSTTVSAQKLLVLGDSLSAGYGISEQDGWVEKLRQRLVDEKISVDVINASVSGETTAGGKARLPQLIERHRPQWLIVELGGNDGLRGYPLNVMKQNLQEIIALSQASGAEVLLLGMQIPPNYGKRYTRMFSNTFSTLAEANRIALVPFFLDQVATQPRLMQADGIHPTAEGQLQMLNNVWPYLHPLL